MQFSTIDISVMVLYGITAIAIGLALRKRASESPEQYFLSGRTLPWWLAGTSMVATSFAADTPLVVTGWVREFGIWKNWLWWCYASSSLLAIFVFARWWRRARVMTKAEIAEVRYPGKQAKTLRLSLAILHAGFTNTITLCWVLLAAIKIFGVVFEISEIASLSIACGFALVYSLLAGFRGVVVTDIVQFAISVVGAVALAICAWNEVGGLPAILESVPKDSETLRFFPHPGDGPLWSLDFWTASFCAFCVYIGVAWWGAEHVDGSGTMIQRVSASRTERDGALAVLWYTVLHNSLRPWPWIMVALASLVVLPSLAVESPSPGEVVAITESAIVVEAEPGDRVEVSRVHPDATADWQAERVHVEVGDSIDEGAVLVSADPEKAYVVMLARYLPAGLLGLVVVSLIAAFMSTIDTHVNLASSFFVNDVYRRFIRPESSDRHLVLVARFTGVVVMLVAAFFATVADSLGDLFVFFLAFLAGVGPVYVLRWLWWRITATTELIAMSTSAITATSLTFLPIEWQLGPFSDNGALSPVGRLLIVVALSSTTALLSLLVEKRPDPASLVPFYRRVRPGGAWGPVRALAPDVEVLFDPWRALVGFVGGFGLIVGGLFAVGALLLDRQSETYVYGAVAAFGAIAAAWGLDRSKGEEPEADPDA